MSRGFAESRGDAAADYFLINTCTVTSGADQKSRNIIRRCMQSNPHAGIIVTGCLVENDWKAVSSIKFPGLVVKKSFFPEGISGFSQHTRAFLKIQDGCDNFCSYCKVALVRGKKRSKPLSKVIEEARRLAGAGFKEIVLTGICLGAYGLGLNGKISLLDALEGLERINGLLRIRLSSIESGDVTAGLIGYMSASKKLCRHLHIPVQSGDDRILKLMNRKYTSRQYRDLIYSLKKAVPGISVTTDCLVGFPGESSENFKNTIKLIKEIKPLKVHIFPYSARPGTKAAVMDGAVEAKTIRSRCEELERVSLACRDRIQHAAEGDPAVVLVEGRCKNTSGCLEGLTDNYFKVELPYKKGLKNKLVEVKLKGVRSGVFAGEYIDNPRFRGIFKRT